MKVSKHMSNVTQVKQTKPDDNLPQGQMQLKNDSS